MRILQLCKKIPYPVRDGETIAVSYLSKALVDLGCEITLLTMNTTKHYTKLERIPPELQHYSSVEIIDLDNNIKLKDAFLNLFSSSSYHIDRYIDDSFRDKLIYLLSHQKFDIIQLETLYLAPYLDIIRKHTSALVTMRAHNVEFEIWERITKNTSFLPKKIYLKYLTKKLKIFELDHLNKYDYLIPVSPKDLITFKKLGYNNGAFTSPIGLRIKDYLEMADKHVNPKKFSICFIGALDWMPNLQGLDWFMKNVWPKLEKMKKPIQLNIAGRNSPNILNNIHLKNVKVHGEISNSIEFINNNDIMVVPLFSGSGMRVKIIEGMALGKTVITTTLGLEGISAKNYKEILIADTPDEFLEKIIFCHSNPKQVKKIGAAARQYVVQFYDNIENAKLLLEIYEKLLLSPHYN